MSLFWSPDLKFKPVVRNPKPPIPKLGWKPAQDFPDLSAAGVISFDVETYDPQLKEYGPGWARGSGHIVGIAIGTEDGYSQYFPIRHKDGFNHEPEKVIRYAKEQLGRNQQPKIGHNVLYDIGWCEYEGMSVSGEIHDTWTAEKLINHNADASLEGLGQNYLGEGKDSDELYDWAWLYWGKGEAKDKSAKRTLAMQNLHKVPSELVGFYAESDVKLPPLIAAHQYEKLNKLGLWDVYRMECDLIPLLVKMRLAGVSVNIKQAEQTYEEINTEIDELQKKINHIAGTTVNTGSPIEMGRVFDNLGIKYPLTPKTGQPQLKAEFIQTINHPIAELIIEIEELKKANSTFVKGYILDSNVNGKIHGSFNPLRAVTGRMSSSDPNLQNIPSRKDVAKKIRSIFVPDDGDVAIGKWDYSSVESRILAHFAVGEGAKALRQQYNDEPFTDYHKWTIKTVQETTGILLDRKHAKTVSFGLGYGASKKKLASMLGLTLEEAEPLFDAYHSGLPFVASTMKHLSDYAEKNGFTKTVLGRRAIFDKWEPRYTEKGEDRPFPLEFSKAVKVWGTNIKRSHLHKAVNYTIQGSAADLMKMAMVKCWKDGVFDEIGVPRLVVHDELVYSIKENARKEAFMEMQHIMENAVKFKIPIKTEGEVGPNWAQTEKIEW